MTQAARAPCAGRRGERETSGLSRLALVVTAGVIAAGIVCRRSAHGKGRQPEVRCRTRSWTAGTRTRHPHPSVGEGLFALQTDDAARNGFLDRLPGPGVENGCANPLKISDRVQKRLKIAELAGIKRLRC